jgi:hypothetical protein
MEQQNGDNPTLTTDGAMQQNVNDLLIKYYGEGFNDDYIRDPSLVSWIVRMNCADIQLYDLPNRTCAARKVVNIMREILTAMISKDKEAGELLLFIMVVMQKKLCIDKKSEISELILQRVEMWERQLFEDLVQSAEKNSAIGCKKKEKKQSELEGMQKEQVEFQEAEQFTKIVKRLMNDGNLRQAGNIITQTAFG